MGSITLYMYIERIVLILLFYFLLFICSSFLLWIVCNHFGHIYTYVRIRHTWFVISPLNDGPIAFTNTRERHAQSTDTRAHKHALWICEKENCLNISSEFVFLRFNGCFRLINYSTNKTCTVCILKQSTSTYLLYTYMYKCLYTCIWSSGGSSLYNDRAIASSWIWCVILIT